MDPRGSKGACILQKHILTFSPKIIEIVSFILGTENNKKQKVRN